VFDFVAAPHMVALFDEFDALGKEREDASEHGELRRVVNAVLQMLDTYEGRSLIIAATNHESMLDTAIWRRFEEVLFLKPPTVPQLKRLLSVKLRGVHREFSIDDVAGQGWFKDPTHAEVERVLRRALKEMVLQGGELRLRIEYLKAASRRENARWQRTRTRRVIPMPEMEDSRPEPPQLLAPVPGRVALTRRQRFEIWTVIPLLRRPTSPPPRSKSASAWSKP